MVERIRRFYGLGGLKKVYRVGGSVGGGMSILSELNDMWVC
jgi:hypothetical protein